VMFVIERSDQICMLSFNSVDPADRLGRMSSHTRKRKEKNGDDVPLK
jgi:hypothetical protein